MRRETIRRYDVEADAGEQHDPGSSRLGVSPGESLEHRDLSGDVQVMRARPDTGVGHRSPGVREGSCAMQHHRGTSECGIQRGGIVDTRRAPFQAQQLGLCPHGVGITSGECGAQATRECFGHDEAPRVAGGAVDQEHDEWYACGRVAAQRPARNCL